MLEKIFSLIPSWGFLFGVAAILLMGFLFVFMKKLEVLTTENRVLRRNGGIIKGSELGEFIKNQREKLSVAHWVLGELCDTTGEVILLIELGEKTGSEDLIIKIGEELRFSDEEKIVLYDLFLKEYFPKISKEKEFLKNKGE